MQAEGLHKLGCRLECLVKKSPGVVQNHGFPSEQEGQSAGTGDTCGALLDQTRGSSGPAPRLLTEGPASSRGLCCRNVLPLPEEAALLWNSCLWGVGRGLQPSCCCLFAAVCLAWGKGAGECRKEGRKEGGAPCLPYPDRQSVAESASCGVGEQSCQGFLTELPGLAVSQRCWVCPEGILTGALYREQPCWAQRALGLSPGVVEVRNTTS